VLVWKFDRFARSTRHLLAALEEFNHLGVRFISVQDQIDTDSPMGRAKIAGRASRGIVGEITKRARTGNAVI
jgi:DNA invertase Pin-like site-specific DNA recombinase